VFVGDISIMNKLVVHIRIHIVDQRKMAVIDSSWLSSKYP
jgi:hypothetical protein